MEMYDAPETISTDSKHTVLLKFQYGEHKAEVVTTMGGNTYGADLLSTYDEDAISWLTAPVANPTNIKHCVFAKSDKPSADIELIVFLHPKRPLVELAPGEAAAYLIGMEIIAYDQPEESDDGDEDLDDEG